MPDVLSPALRQAVSNAALPTNEGELAWRSTRKTFALYDGTRERGVASVGFAPFATQLGHSPTLATSTGVALAAVSGGNGGAIAIPIWIPAHMLLQSCTIWQTDTSLARTAEWRLYEDRNNDSNSLNEIVNANGTWSFTPSAASAQTSTPASPPIYLEPGFYWLVIRNTSASRVLTLGSAAASATPLGNTAQTKAIPALGSTLDFVAATWAKTTAVYGARLNGRGFGQTSAF